MAIPAFTITEWHLRSMNEPVSPKLSGVQKGIWCKDALDFFATFYKKRFRVHLNNNTLYFSTNDSLVVIQESSEEVVVTLPFHLMIVLRQDWNCNFKCAVNNVPVDFC